MGISGNPLLHPLHAEAGDPFSPLSPPAGAREIVRLLLWEGSISIPSLCDHGTLADPGGLRPELLGPVGKEEDRGRMGPGPWVPIHIPSQPPLVLSQATSGPSPQGGHHQLGESHK